jgi:GT2 family glycosyltransferase
VQHDSVPAAAVSVIVVNWNRASLLRSCLESLQAQSCVNFEIVIVDNGSTDDSHEVIENFNKTSSIPLQLIKNERNFGFCAANNQGIAAARGEFIALLNNDAEADPGWLDAMWRELHARPGASQD